MSDINYRALDAEVRAMGLMVSALTAAMIYEAMTAAAAARMER